mmetsp:Transcript_24483/g.40804  ORF Transcript_24483/g.40804 Transcript_24483/m.40804 type:complete len:279 (-) Transcript_24483:2-838(-)
MVDIYEDLARVGQISISQNLAGNLLYWMTWVAVQPGNIAQRFYMTGSPLAVFERQHTVGMLSNYLADCNATSVGSFDPSTGILSVTYNINEFNSNPTCNTTSNPALFGHTEYTHSDEFVVAVDVMSLVTTVAVNLGITFINDLQPFSYGTLTFEDITYQTVSYVDPRYPGMKPVLCLLLTQTAPRCVLQVGAVYALPVFHHNGNNNTYPDQCNCSNPDQAFNNAFDNCNVFNFLTGFIYWPNTTASFLATVELILSSSYVDVSNSAYKPMFTAGIFRF